MYLVYTMSQEFVHTYQRTAQASKHPNVFGYIFIVHVCLLQINQCIDCTELSITMILFRASQVHVRIANAPAVLDSPDHYAKTVSNQTLSVVRSV